VPGFEFQGCLHVQLDIHRIHASMQMVPCHGRTQLYHPAGYVFTSTAVPNMGAVVHRPVCSLRFVSAWMNQPDSPVAEILRILQSVMQVQHEGRGHIHVQASSVSVAPYEKLWWLAPVWSHLVPCPVTNMQSPSHAPCNASRDHS
jgi:hypothetical protein